MVGVVSAICMQSGAVYEDVQSGTCLPVDTADRGVMADRERDDTMHLSGRCWLGDRRVDDGDGNSDSVRGLGVLFSLGS